ncbi:MAG: hypothetical protein QGG42_18255 [Phycisphaerae bacterium]|jgi:hypothetical protein|nr:hypothetical protein [Phycisphaerae bacterium]
MKHERHHWLEKLQVEFAGAAALAVTFFLIGPMHGWWDPQWPTTFIPTGSFAGLFKFGLLVWILAVGCAALTVSSRPEGALFATLIGAVGVSMHSTQIKILLWSREAHFAGVFLQLIVELLVLFVIVVGAIHIIRQVRGLIARIRPDWMWRGRITAETVASGPQKTESAAIGKLDSWPARLLWALSPVGSEMSEQTPGTESSPAASPAKEAKNRKASLVCTVSCLAATVLYSSIMLMLLMRSTNRGQIIFALFASFLLATLIAHQQFATRFSVVSWATPLITGVLFYMLAIASSGKAGMNIWTGVQHWALALPIDWMTAGGAGGVLGYWVSERIHELRHIERHAENESS